MAYKNFVEFPENERDDFKFSCRKLRIPPENFTVTAEENLPLEDQMPNNRIVHVLKFGQREGRAYLAGIGVNWTAAFEYDLLAGEFDLRQRDLYRL